jgi:hypothetical protein
MEAERRLAHTHREQIVYLLPVYPGALKSPVNVSQGAVQLYNLYTPRHGGHSRERQYC